MTATEYQELESRIRRDLGRFRDPGTEIQVVEAGARAVTARWESYGRSLAADFRVEADGTLRVQTAGRTIGYRAFLASPLVADLNGLAEMILRSPAPEHFIPARAEVVTDQRQEPAEDALALLQRELSSQDSGVTDVLFVTAAAGAGKTYLLRELVRKCAANYIEGRTDTLYLYVNAQGRALANLNEALAVELQDLRARLTYDAVAPLVRAGLLVPVIDGFDELVATGGTDDAFGSLGRFIEELNGAGRIVATARSAYYEQEFRSKALTVSSLGKQLWRTILVALTPWSESELDAFVAAVAPEEPLLGRDLRVLFSQAPALAQKPLFISETIKLIRLGVRFSADKPLLEQLVSAHIQREHKEKLVDRNQSPLLSEEQIRLLLQNVAEEMWLQETRELDSASLRAVAEVVLTSEAVPPSAVVLVMQRMPSLALLTTAEGRTQFEHEYYFGYFIATVFANAFDNRERFATLLGRSSVPPEASDVAAKLLERAGTSPTALIQSFGELAEKERFDSAQIRENCGSLAWRVLRDARTPLEGAFITSMTFSNADLGGIDFRGCLLRDVLLHRVDLTRCRFEDCRSERLRFEDVLIDLATTTLGISGLDPDHDIFALRVRSEAGIEKLFDPRRIRAALAACHAPDVQEPPPQTTRNVSPDLVELLHRVQAAYGRQNLLYPDDDFSKSIRTHPLWADVERLLVRSEVVQEEFRSQKGTSRKALRLRCLPDQLMAGLSRVAPVPANVTRFWDAAEERFPP